MIGRVYYLVSAADPRDRLGLGKRMPRPRSYWRVVARGEPFDRGPRRNVLLERVLLVEVFWWGEPAGLRWVSTGRRTVRPFRGLRRA